MQVNITGQLCWHQAGRERERERDHYAAPLNMKHGLQQEEVGSEYPYSVSREGSVCESRLR